MFLQGVLLTALAVLEITVTLPVQKKIEPVDIKYYCLQIKKDGKTNDQSPVLLIHGLGASHKSWDGVYQVIALRTGRRICRVDLRNHGDSPWNNRTDVASMTADIEHFLHKQSIKKVNIIGHSLGGNIGVHYTLNNPEKVDSLVVEDMRPNGINEPSLNLVRTFINFLQQAIDFVPKGLFEQQAKKYILSFINKKLKEIGIKETIDDSVAKALEIRPVKDKWHWKMNIEIISNALKNPAKFFTESAGLYEGPTLFIYGTASTFDVYGDKENIVKLFPNAKLVPIDGAGHIIHGQHREFEDNVIKFYNGL